MRDLNFFSNYIKSRYADRKRAASLIVVVVIIAAIIGGAYAVTEVFAWRLSSSIAKMNSYLESEELAKKMEVIDQKKQQIAIIGKYNDLVDQLNIDYERADLIDSELIESIDKTMPANVVLTSISFNPSDINITASSASRTEIAEFQHNLNELGIFTTVSVGNILASAGAERFEFDLTAYLEGVTE
jgi:Tfp pilus assembly protein PilN